MYCPSCGNSVKVMSTACSACGYSIDLKLYELEAEKTASDLKKQDIKCNKKYAVLSYLGPLVIVPLLVSKESDFLNFHTNQGFIMCIAYLISVLSFLLPNMGKFIGLMLLLVSLALGAWGIVNVIKGENKELPYIGKFKILRDNRRDK